LEFTPSKPLTVGIELELQLLDKENLNLTNGIGPLLKCYPRSPYIKPEFIQNTVEVISKVGENTAQVHAHLAHLVKEVRQTCLTLGMELCAAGTHPFDKELALFTPLPRYLRMEKDAGYLGHAQITFATQVHIGVQEAAEALYLMHAFKAYLPLLIALSASSPFWRGYDTGFASYRQRVLAATRSYGIPPSFNDWQHFMDFYNALQRAGMIQTINDIHWDIRVRPHWGTVEVRVMDAQPTLTESMQLASFIRVLAAYLLAHSETSIENMPHALPWWIEKDNCYMASRLGLEANCVVDKNGSFKSIYEIWQAVQAEIQSYAYSIGESRYFEQLIKRVAERNISYQRQRNVYQATHSCDKVVSTLIKELADDLACG
jgi:carboxylate-amine ligase